MLSPGLSTAVILQVDLRHLDGAMAHFARQLEQLAATFKERTRSGCTRRGPLPHRRAQPPPSGPPLHCSTSQALPSVTAH
ncbi:hypothetical protein [Ktedonobacter robiniae]|uniref:hypothetical protein n=1 Tax=Ktedonobacter robiniae TaxID=2778365 RepID=UPI0019163812|nr:hypothetical protein [Ktedonobacter robiniae]